MGIRVVYRNTLHLYIHTDMCKCNLGLGFHTKIIQLSSMLAYYESCEAK
jgi:hypothetical protein